MENIGQRIKQLRKKLGLTQKEFAEKIGKSFRAIQEYEAGRRNPDESTLRLIAKTFGVNLDWLKTGEGEMFLGTVLTAEETKEFIQVPLYDIFVSAGEGIEAEETTPVPIKVSAEFARSFLGVSSAKGLFMVVATGNSMYPTIKPGDYLIGKLWDYEGFLIEGAVYIFRKERELYVKRFSKRDEKNKRLIFTSDNPDYPELEITEQQLPDIKIIGRLIRNIGAL